jgi:hypothetical protein
MSFVRQGQVSLRFYGTFSVRQASSQGAVALLKHEEKRQKRRYAK